MDNKKNIEDLRKAIELFPNNNLFRRNLANLLFEEDLFEEASEHFSVLVQHENDETDKFKLSECFYSLGQFGKCLVLVEQQIEEMGEDYDFDWYRLYCLVLFKNKEIKKCRNVYQRLLENEPFFNIPELDQEFRMPNYYAGESPDEDFLNDILEDEGETIITFEDVGGMDGVKNEIDLKIIKPLQHADLYKAYGKKTGGGILLYGPPGCGKTFIAKATAGEVNAKFISVGLNDILDMWIGNSEKNLHEMFDLARRHTPSVLFFDEIDALGASRNDMKQSAGRHLINQFLLDLDGVESSNDGVLVLGATNAPWHLDQAFRRPGRFDRIIFVPPPDMKGREVIFKLKLKDKPQEKIDFEELAKKTEFYSGADIEAVVDIAIESKLSDSFKTGIPQPLKTSDLLNAIKKHKPSTQEWFNTAKNYAMFANETGIYDEVINYMKLKKN
ncbi:MAG: AAA family ATPase [Cytophagales bacterium]